MFSFLETYLSDYTVNFEAAILLWPLLSIFLSLPILLLLYRRDGWLRLPTVFVVYVCVLYIAGLGCFTIYPLPSGDSGPGITYGIEPILNPLNFIDAIAADGLSAVLQLVFNILLFVPLGFMAKFLFKLNLAATLGLSFAATLLIETAQLTGLFGIYPYAYRYFEVDDLICNTMGGVIGWALGYLLMRFLLREPSERIEITHSPSFIRRFVALWTDLMIIDVCYVVPRIVIVAGAVILTGSSSSAFGVPMELVNQVVSSLCFLVSFLVVEVIVPWRGDGCTPAGRLYRMSFETKERRGAYRVCFYICRTAIVFLIFSYPLYTAIPLVIFYAVTQKMPYDFIPAEDVAEGCLAESCEDVLVE